MVVDKFKAVWVSHSSIADFLKCPRLYYLRNVYKDPKTGNKITIMSPSLSLGQIVHFVVEGLSVLPVDQRFSIPLTKKFEVEWQRVSGKVGGFKSKNEEDDYKELGLEMLKRIEKSPGPLVEKAVKIKQDLPYYWLSEEENIILCGKIDWLKWVEKNDSVHIIDFKTGKNEESEDSLQLPIYLLLATNTQKRPVSGASYWYLRSDDGPVEQKLPDILESQDKILGIAKRIKTGRQINHLKCPKGGCFACKDLERVYKGEGEKVGVSEYRQDIYILD